MAADKPLLYNQFINPKADNAHGSQPYRQPGYLPHQQTPVQSCYPPPQGYAPPQRHQPSSYRATSVYAPLGGEGYNRPTVDPYYSYYQQAQQMNHQTGSSIGQYHLPPPNTMPHGAVPRPNEVKVTIHLRKSIVFFVVSLLTIILCPIVPCTLSALVCSLRARMLHNKRNYEGANKRGSNARRCLVISLVATIFWCIAMFLSLLISYFVYFSFA